MRYFISSRIIRATHNGHELVACTERLVKAPHRTQYCTFKRASLSFIALKEDGRGKLVFCFNCDNYSIYVRQLHHRIQDEEGLCKKAKITFFKNIYVAAVYI